jgi:hypothetical protein
MTKVSKNSDFANLSPFERFQLEKYGDIIPFNDCAEFENGSIEHERFTEYVQREAEQNLFEYE